jgi:hypothetical protein
MLRVRVRVRVRRTVHTCSGRNCNISFMRRANTDIPPKKPRTEHRNKFCYDVLLRSAVHTVLFGVSSTLFCYDVLFGVPSTLFCYDVLFGVPSTLFCSGCRPHCSVRGAVDTVLLRCSVTECRPHCSVTMFCSGCRPHCSVRCSVTSVDGPLLSLESQNYIRTALINHHFFHEEIIH